MTGPANYVFIASGNFIVTIFAISIWYSSDPFVLAWLAAQPMQPSSLDLNLSQFFVTLICSRWLGQVDLSWDSLLVNDFQYPSNRFPKPISPFQLIKFWLFVVYFYLRLHSAVFFLDIVRRELAHPMPCVVLSITFRGPVSVTYAKYRNITWQSTPHDRYCMLMEYNVFLWDGCD